MATEVVCGDYVIRLDDTVLEVLHAQGESRRWHVRHVAVDAKLKGSHLKLNIGRDADGVVLGGYRIDVPPERRDAVLALFAESRARRDALPPG